MDKLLSMLLGVTENVLSGVPIRNQCHLLDVVVLGFCPANLATGLWSPTELEKPLRLNVVALRVFILSPT